MIIRAKVNNATDLTVTGLKWFKVISIVYGTPFTITKHCCADLGRWLRASDQSWGVDRLIANKGKVSFTIPSCIAAGQYLLRVEMIGT